MSNLNNDTRTIENVKNAIKSEYKSRHNWRKVADVFGITGGMAYRIAHGYEPREAHIRHVLHLPALVEVAPCAKCGEIHLRRTCPQTTRPRNRRAINLVDPVSAAATIRNHADAAYIARLVELLNIGE